MRRLIVCGKEMGGVIAALVVLTALSFPFLVSGAGEEDELIFCEENSDCPANGRCFLGICLIQEDSSPRSGGVQVGGRCGDGVLNMNEECDPPNEDSCGFDELGNIVLCCKTDCTLTQCSDDGDNDGDLKRDCDDPGCWECPRCALEGQRSDCNLVDDQELDPCTNPNIPAQMIEADLKLGDVLAGGGIQLKEYNSLLGRLLAKGGGVFAQFCIDRGFTPIIRGGVCNTCACPKSSGKSMRPMSASDALRTGSRHLDFRCEDGGSVPQTCGESAAPECGGSCSVGETCHSTDGICSCMSLCTPGEDFPECPLINEEGCYGFGQNCESGSLCCTPKGIVEMVGTHGCCSNFYQCGKSESKENICVQCETDQECLSEPALVGVNTNRVSLRQCGHQHNVFLEISPKVHVDA
jgi:hypothetical protein